MIDWKRYEDELATARTATIATEIVVAARRSRRHQLLAVVGFAAAALLLAHACGAPARRRVYQIATTIHVRSSTAR